MRALLLAPLALALALPAAAQQAPSAEEVEALLARMQQQLERMSAASAERDQALKFLEQQIEAATGRLSTSGQTAESLRQSKAELESKVETLASDREQLQAKLETVEDQRARQIRELSTRLDQLNAMLAGLERDKAGLERERAGLGERLAAAEAARAAEGERRAALEQEVERRGRRIAELEARLGELRTALGEREERLGASTTEIDRLNRLLSTTTSQLQQVAGALERSQSEVERQKLVIADLGQRLNAALLEQVEQLEQYRSEFFGRLRQILGERPDVVIVGDRFVFPSELLFPSGSARLEPGGEAQLERLAATLREVAATIPPDIDWVLRVDGHTDRRPVGPGSPFRSNWELSSARAISVVEFLIGKGIPPERLVAAGFGEHRPLDPGEGEAAFRRNRRIEFKLTER